MQQVDYIGNADARVVRSSDMAAVGFSSPDLVWNKLNNYELLISDDLLAAWLIAVDSKLVIQNPPTTFQEILGKYLGFKPAVFWMHDVGQRIPSGKWVPVALNNRLTTQGSGWDDGIDPHSPVPQTTIAAGSNGLNLPQTSLHVTDASVLKAATVNRPEWVVVRNGGLDTIVKYTGKNVNQLTGTTGWGDTTTPMVTGDLVRQANVAFFAPGNEDDPNSDGGLANVVGDVAWSSNDVGGRWTQILFLDALGPDANLSGAGGYCRPVLTPGAPSTTPWVRTTVQEQPAGPGRNRFEVFQNSGSILELPVYQLGAPRLVCVSVTNVDL